ncbi:MAG: methyl-accepting chemotaxis protein [Alicyclobacillaceae bacterium]|nr:methyl-accepting chemotaxis protein [Alicyclobacillaceae bacterium]
MRLSIKVKIIGLFSLVIILGTAAMGTFATLVMKAEVGRASSHKLQSDLELGKAVLDSRIPGAWSIRNGQLYKGETLINGNTDLVDQIGAVTGNTVTIFQEDTRVATTRKTPDGRRALGTKVSEVVAQTTLKEQRVYIGPADVTGTVELAAYEPIQDAQGRVIGIWGMSMSTALYDQMQRDFQVKVLLFGAVGLAIAIALSWLVANRMARPLITVTDVARRVAQGDLNVEKVSHHSADELGVLAESVNSMVDSLRTLIKKVRETSEQVAAASEQLFGSSEQMLQVTNHVTEVVQEVSEGAKTQVRQSEESAASVEEMAAGTQRIAESATVVSQSSVETAARAEEGNDRLQKAVRQMDSIGSSVRESTQAIEVLDQCSKQIGQIVEVISGIAAQTNLLALNAAIEAARAGEHGRGFVVVADEVRKLAEKCQESASQIAELVGAIQKDTQRSVKAMGAVAREVQVGIEAVQEAGEAFQHILSAVRHVADQIQEISAATQQLSAGAQEISTTVNHMAAIAKGSMGAAGRAQELSEEQLAAMEEVSSAAHSLSRMAQELQELVHRFKV